jgi:hypothetical protein
MGVLYHEFLQLPQQGPLRVFIPAIRILRKPGPNIIGDNNITSTKAGTNALARNNGRGNRRTESLVSASGLNDAANVTVLGNGTDANVGLRRDAGV